MKKLSLIFCMIFTLLAAVDVSAATATIKRVWLEHGVKINNRAAMKVHCEFTVQGMKGKKGHMCVWIKNSSGNWHKVNGTNHTSDGTSYFVWDFAPGYEDAVYNDWWYAPYIDDLCLLPGKNDYKVVVTICDDAWKQLAQSQELSFTGTGSSNSNNAPANNNNNRNNNQVQNNGVETYREDLGYGGFVIVNKYASGYIMRTRYRLCPNCKGTQICASCHGTLRCPLCQGRGGIITAGYGNYLPCAMCNRTGRCNLCSGTGRCACTKAPNQYPGYVIGSTATIAPDGTTNRETVDYNTNTNRSYESKPAAKKTCPDCDGTRLWHKGRSPEYARPNSQLVGYYNPSGTKCPHCGYLDEHWHSKCATCKHYYGTENPYR